MTKKTIIIMVVACIVIAAILVLCFLQVIRYQPRDTLMASLNQYISETDISGKWEDNYIEQGTSDYYLKDRGTILSLIKLIKKLKPFEPTSTPTPTSWAPLISANNAEEISGPSAAIAVVEALNHRSRIPTWKNVAGARSR